MGVSDLLIRDFIRKDAHAKYSLDTFGHDLIGNYTWERTDSTKDLVLGDGSDASTFPTLVNDEGIQYYRLDGVNDHFSSWPTMPEIYTVIAALSGDYHFDRPYIQSCSDETIQDLLTTPGAYNGNVHSLLIFDYALSPLEYFFVEQKMLQRLWSDYVDPFAFSLIRDESCVLLVDCLRPDGLSDVSEYEQTVTLNDVTWDEGVTFGVNENILVSHDTSLDLDEITIHVTMEPGTGVICYKRDNIHFEAISTTEYLLNGSVISLPSVPRATLTVTVRDGEAPTAYVDGVLIGDGDAISDDMDFSIPRYLYIGNDDTGLSPFTGALKRISIFNSVLSGAEIRGLFIGNLGMDYDPDIEIGLVDGDDMITEDQTGVSISMINAGSDIGKVYLSDNPTLGLASTVVEQPIVSWADTEIVIDIDIEIGGL